MVDEVQFSRMAQILKPGMQLSGVRLNKPSSIECDIEPAHAPPPGFAEQLERAAELFASEASLAFAVMGGKENQLSPAQLAAIDILVLAERHFSELRWSDMADDLQMLTGLGPGLTPAGDDFLIGVLAACVRWDGREVSKRMGQLLKKAVLAHPESTTWLAAELLKCAACGEFAPSIIRVLKARGKTEMMLAAAQGASCGHTSGSDALGGMLWLSKLASKSAELTPA
jgi:hypothetical protein